ncbi:MAG: hypothetical protein U9Q77_01955 [Candidatus Marinimicrobia bacterium]|nr:hypothetical protein [Candidatus Neomarinimicrobiota bacterium]
MENQIKTPEDLPWLASLKKDPIPVLLQAAPLPIRYQVLRDLLGDQDSDDFEALQKNLRKHKPRRKKLAEQQADGLWPMGNPIKGLDPKQIQTLQFITQLESLHELLELIVTNKTEKVVLGMREVIRFLAEKELPLRFHHVTQAIYLAIEFKLESNPVIKQLVRGVFNDQNSDGGWSSLVDEQESCIWSSLFFLWTMGHSQIFRKNRSLQKGLRYVSSNLLLQDQSQLLPGMQVWDTLITGTSGLSLLTGGSLRYLETVQLLDGDKRDRKAEKLVDWLVGIQLRDGLWPSIVGRDKHGDFGVTLRVLKVLKHFQSLRINETRDYEEF